MNEQKERVLGDGVLIGIYRPNSWGLNFVVLSVNQFGKFEGLGPTLWIFQSPRGGICHSLDPF